MRVATLPPACFQPGATLAYRGDATFWRPATLWLRFTAPDLAPSSAPWYLVVSTFVTDGDLTLVAPGGRILASEHFGSTIPVAERPVPSHDIRVPVPARLPAGTRFVVRLTGPYSVPDVLQLQTGAALAAQDDAVLRDAGLPFAFLNGGALTMALFNLVLWTLLRRSIYLIYAAAIAALVFYQCVEVGAAWTLFWPHLGLRDDYPSYAAWVLYVGLIVTFTRRMLNTRHAAPAVDRALVIVFGLVVVDSTIYVLFPDQLLKAGIFTWLDPTVTALMSGTMLVSGLVAWQRGVTGALAYVVAFGGSAIGIVASDVATYDPALAAYPALAYLPTSYGVLWESVFLALALGQRVRDAERDAARLSEFAFRDALTGIANRRAFDVSLEGEWSRAQRTGAMVAVVMFDIDNFKQYNDRYGHPAGDERLIVVARAIAQSARRTNDLAARYGGEEFALLLPYTTLEGAYAIAEGVRQRVAASAENDETRVTLSAGVAVAMASSNPDDRRALIAAADAALYSAKTGGRDRTVRWNTLLGAAPVNVEST